MKKNKKNLIICVEKNTTKRDFQRFGINYLSKFYNIDIINFYNLINKKKIKKSKYEKNIKNLSDLLKLIEKKKYVGAIDYLRTSQFNKTIKIKKILQQNNVKVIQVHNGLLPIEKKFSKDKLLKIFKLKFLVKYILKKLNNFLFNQSFIYDISLISGLEAENIYPETKFSKKKIYTHSFDYETTLKKKKILNKKNLGIFIDENLISHPDYKLFNIDINRFKSEYYKNLRKTLKYFEKKYKIKIVICVHHSLWNKNFNNFFKGFKCVIGKTEEYSKKASLTILHQSTAISFSVIYKKPLIFLNYSKLKSTFIFNNINRMAKLFNKKPYFIDKEILHNKIIDFKVDKRHYSKYLNNYIIHPKANKKYSMWNLLVKEINR